MMNAIADKNGYLYADGLFYTNDGSIVEGRRFVETKQPDGTITYSPSEGVKLHYADAVYELIDDTFWTAHLEMLWDMPSEVYGRLVQFKEIMANPAYGGPGKSAIVSHGNVFSVLSADWETPPTTVEDVLPDTFIVLDNA